MVRLEMKGSVDLVVTPGLWDLQDLPEKLAFPGTEASQAPTVFQAPKGHWENEDRLGQQVPKVNLET